MTERLLLAVAAVLVLGGCPKPLDFGPRGVITDPAEIIDALASRAERVRATQGEARANIDTPKGGGGLDLFVVAEEPSHFRLEALSFFGQPIGVIATDGETFGYHDLQSGTFVDGPATPANVSRLLPVALPAEELTALLLGEVPLVVDPERAEVRLSVDQDARAYRLDLADASLRQRIWVETDTLRPRAWVVPDRPSLQSYRAELDDFDGDTDRPKTVRLATADRQYRVELKWRDRELDPEIDPALFRVQRPAPPSPPDGT